MQAALSISRAWSRSAVLRSVDVLRTKHGIVSTSPEKAANAQVDRVLVQVSAHEVDWAEILTNLTLQLLHGRKKVLLFLSAFITASLQHVAAFLHRGLATRDRIRMDSQKI